MKLFQQNFHVLFPPFCFLIPVAKFTWLKENLEKNKFKLEQLTESCNILANIHIIPLLFNITNQTILKIFSMSQSIWSSSFKTNYRSKTHCPTTKYSHTFNKNKILIHYLNLGFQNLESIPVIPSPTPNFNFISKMTPNPSK